MKRNPWPYAIVGYFVLFITGVVTWVVYATHHQDQLIRPDYYEHEIRYQQHIDTVARTAALRSGVQIHYDLGNRTVTLALPARAAKMTGTIQLYRPSDSKLDKTFPLTLDEHSAQTLSVDGMESGLWKLHLSWSADGTDYYFDQPLVLAGK
jgi:nitrogen fixation protein FixH